VEKVEMVYHILLVVLLLLMLEVAVVEHIVEHQLLMGKVVLVEVEEVVQDLLVRIFQLLQELLTQVVVVEEEELPPQLELIMEKVVPVSLSSLIQLNIFFNTFLKSTHS